MIRDPDGNRIEISAEMEHMGPRCPASGVAPGGTDPQPLGNGLDANLTRPSLQQFWRVSRKRTARWRRRPSSAFIGERADVSRD